MMVDTCGLVKWNLSACIGNEDNDSSEGQSIAFEGIGDVGKIEDANMEVIIKLYLISGLCVLGIMGNIVSIVVLSKDRERREGLFLLQALAFADGLYLLVAILRYPLKYLIYDKGAYVAMQPYVFPLIKTCQFICIWMMVLVTIDRFVFVHRPWKAPSLFNHRTRKIFTVLVFGIGLLYNLPRYFALCILYIEDTCTNQTTSRMVYTPSFSNTLYFDIYQYAMYIIILYIAPLAIVGTMNVRLLQSIRNSRKRSAQIRPNVTHHVKENNATLVLVIIIAVFIICETPELVLRILTVIHRHHQNIPLFNTNTQLYLQHFNAISELLMVVNSSVNFLIYTFFGKRFRQIMKETFSGATVSTHEIVPLQKHNQNVYRK